MGILLNAADADENSVTVRGPTLDDTNFNVKPLVARDNIIPDEPNDWVDHEWNIELEEVVAGSLDHVVFQSLDEDVATINQDGEITRVSDGSARINIVTPLKIKQVTAPVYREPANSLSAHIINAISTRIAGVTPSVARPMYDQFEWPHTIGNRNVNSFLYGLDMTGWSPWNSSYNLGAVCTLISPRHFVCAEHWHPNNGATIEFITQDNTVVSRTISNAAVISGTDIRVGVLNSDVPETIGFHKVLPVNWSDYLQLDYVPDAWSSPRVPVVFTERNGLLCVGDLLSLTLSNYVNIREPLFADRLALWKLPIVGDSSHRICMLIDDELILLGCFHYPTGGPFLTAYITQINAAMTTLGGGYQLTTKDLSSFYTY